MTDAGKAFEKLVDIATSMTMCAPGDRIRLWRRRGFPEPMPEEFTPGRLLKYLSPEEQEAIKTLTSDEVARLARRPEWIPVWD